MSTTQLPGALIASIGTHLPANKVSNDDLAKIVDTSDEWIFSKTGIRFRHIAGEGENTSSLSAQAANIALERANLDPADVELIIMATSSGDYNSIPSTACVVQSLIGAKNAGAMDLTAACTGFIYGLETARSFIRSGSVKNVLVIGAEVLTRAVDWNDRGSCVLFGDGAGAAVVLPDTDERETDKRLPKTIVIDSVLRSQGKDYDALLRPAGGSTSPLKVDQVVTNDMFMQMNGQRVYLFAVKALGDVIKELLKRNNLELSDIDWIVPHQANSRILEAAAKRLNYPLEQMYSNISEVANTSAASIPLAMNEMADKGLLKKGQKIITVGFGAGLTYGGNLLQL